MRVSAGSLAKMIAGLMHRQRKGGETAHRQGRKVLVSLGGGGGGKAVDDFPPVSADPKLRKKFIANLIDFCLANHYDGIDSYNFV